MCYKIHLNPPRNHRKPWTVDMMLILAMWFKKGAPYDAMCTRMGRTKSSLYTRVSILRVAVKMAPHTAALTGVVAKRTRSSVK